MSSRAARIVTGLTPILLALLGACADPAAIVGPTPAAVTSAPRPEFLLRTSTLPKLAVGDPESCATRTDGAIVCWKNAESQPWPVRITGAEFDGYTFREIVCWVQGVMLPMAPVNVDGHQGLTVLQVPGRPFVHVAMAVGAGICALDVSGGATCWANAHASPSAVPTRGAPRPFAALAGGTRGMCGTRIDGTAACWGLRDDQPSATYLVPTFEMASYHDGVSTTLILAAVPGDYTICVLHTDNTTACWFRFDPGVVGGQNTLELGFVVGQTTVVGVALSTNRVCAALVNGTVRCGVAQRSIANGWYSNAYASATGVPYATIALNPLHDQMADDETACSARRDGAVECFNPRHVDSPAHLIPLAEAQ